VCRCQKEIRLGIELPSLATRQNLGAVLSTGSLDMKKIVNMGCLKGQDQEQIQIVHRRNIDGEFVAFLRMTIGNTADGAVDMAYCLGSIMRQWPIDFPNANNLRRLAVHVLDSEYSKSYQRKCLIAIERYTQFMRIEGVKFKKPKQTQHNEVLPIIGFRISSSLTRLLTLQ